MKQRRKKYSATSKFNRPRYAVRDVKFDFYNVENLYIWHSGGKKLAENKEKEIS